MFLLGPGMFFLDGFFGLVDILVDDLYLASIFAEEVVLEFIDRADDHLFRFGEIDELEEGDFLVELVDFGSEGPVAFLAVLDGGLFVHQPL